jgi:hypothetical protein
MPKKSFNDMAVPDEDLDEKFGDLTEIQPFSEKKYKKPCPIKYQQDMNRALDNLRKSRCLPEDTPMNTIIRVLDKENKRVQKLEKPSC